MGCTALTAVPCVGAGHPPLPRTSGGGIIPGAPSDHDLDDPKQASHGRIRWSGGRCGAWAWTFFAIGTGTGTCTHMRTRLRLQLQLSRESRRHRPHPARVGSDHGSPQISSEQGSRAGPTRRRFLLGCADGRARLHCIRRQAGSPEHPHQDREASLSQRIGCPEAVCSGSGSRLLELFFGSALVRSHPSGQLRGCKAASTQVPRGAGTCLAGGSGTGTGLEGPGITCAQVPCSLPTYLGIQSRYTCTARHQHVHPGQVAHSFGTVQTTANGVAPTPLSLVQYYSFHLAVGSLLPGPVCCRDGPSLPLASETIIYTPTNVKPYREFAVQLRRRSNLTGQRSASGDIFDHGFHQCVCVLLSHRFTVPSSPL